MSDQPGGQAVRVVVADDQPLLRHSLELLINAAGDLTVVSTAATGEEAIASARELRPDLVLMDIRMPGGDGILATRHITSDPDLRATRVLVLSMFALDEYVYAALRAGASGFLLKDAHPDQVLDAIRRTCAGESLFAPSILTRLVGHFLNRPTTDTGGPDGKPGTLGSAPHHHLRTFGNLKALTEREAEVLRLVASGLSNDEIAGALTISIKTVKTHIGNLLAKVGARDRAQLVIAAYEAGLVSAAD